ncbi:MAG: hypothetical protein AB8H79_19920 [Myxococcota bacterium]
MSEALRARLSGPAARFLALLRDFGHLEDQALADILIESCAEATGSEEALVDLAGIRKVAARYLFEQNSVQVQTGEGILIEDWPLLFS